MVQLCVTLFRSIQYRNHRHRYIRPLPQPSAGTSPHSPLPPCPLSPHTPLHNNPILNPLSLSTPYPSPCPHPLLHNSGWTYEGEYERDRRNGEGVITWGEGSTYMGEWVGDVRTGKGWFSWCDWCNWCNCFVSLVIRDVVLISSSPHQPLHYHHHHHLHHCYLTLLLPHIPSPPYLGCFVSSMSDIYPYLAITSHPIH